MEKALDNKYLKSLNKVCTFVVNAKKTQEPVAYTYRFDSFEDLSMKPHYDMIEAIKYAMSTGSILIKDGKEIEYGQLNNNNAYYIADNNIQIVTTGGHK